jgi:hypothetical protein
LDQIGVVIDHVHVQPEHPLVIVESMEQQVVPRLGQDLSPDQLQTVLPARQAERQAEIEILPPKPRSGA